MSGTTPPATSLTGWPTRLPILALVPPGAAAFARAAHAAGALPLFDTGSDSTWRAVAAGLPAYAVRISGPGVDLPAEARVVIVAEGANADASRITLLESSGTTPNAGEGASYVARGATSRATVALVRTLAATGRPVAAWGGLDRATLALAREAGARAFVLAESLWALPEAELTDAARSALARARPGDRVAIGTGAAITLGPDAPLAGFVARRSRTLSRALEDALADAAETPPPAPPAPKHPEVSASSPVSVRAPSPQVPAPVDALAEPIAIVGLGAVLPKAPDVATYWRNVLEGVDAIREVPHERWDPALFHDPDPKAPDKTYAKIGGFVDAIPFDPMRFRIPPTVAASLDDVQKMVLVAASQAFADAGLDKKSFDRERVAVIIGNSMGGEMRDAYARRVYFPEFAEAVRTTPGFAELPAAKQQEILATAERAMKSRLTPITEDSMPGELANVIAGRVANAFDLGGKNCTTDAACASSLAAVDLAMKGLREGEFDVALAGGADRSMDPATYAKFSKIGALSPDGSRPFDERANGFVMGEGAGILVLKRLTDARRDGDRVYAIIRGIGSSSDGKGKGITAPNPKGQELAVRRALAAAKVEPGTIGLVEAHGTGTPVGDVVEVETLAKVFADAKLPQGAVALGSVKSQIGHLKAAAGAASLIKTALALSNRTLPPTLHVTKPNPKIAWNATPFRMLAKPESWPAPTTGPRRAAVSAFGFGGTNYHVILEEDGPAAASVAPPTLADSQAASAAALSTSPQAALEFAAAMASSTNTPQVAPSPTAFADVALFCGPTVDAAVQALADAAPRLAAATDVPTFAAATRRAASARTHVRLAVSLPADKAEAADRLAAVLALAKEPVKRAALPTKGAHLGEGPLAGKLALVFPGQGSQYANMGRDLAARFPVVAETFAEADRVLAPFIGGRLTEFVFADPKDPAAIARAEERLRQTEITQPAVLALDVALHRLLASWGVKPSIVAGHSLGEYAALVVAGVLSFEDALKAVSARGAEMANVKVPDKGRMASVMAPAEAVEKALVEARKAGYVVAANLNSPNQTVIAGSTAGAEAAVALLERAGIQVQWLNVSAAFHTEIVRPAAEPLGRVLKGLRVSPPSIPVVANVTADYYPTDVGAIVALLSDQVASPVRWRESVDRMHAEGVRTFVEVGPKRALAGLIEDSLRGRDAFAIATNHPKRGDAPSLYDAIAKLLALGYDLSIPEPAKGTTAGTVATPTRAAPTPLTTPATTTLASRPPAPASRAVSTDGSAAGLAEAAALAAADAVRGALAPVAAKLEETERFGFVTEPIVITGAAIGLPGESRRIFDDANVDRIFAGENRIDRLSPADADRFLERNIVRLVKGEGEPVFEPIRGRDETVRLAGRAGSLDLAHYAIDAKHAETWDVTTRLAIAAGVEALADARIPLVREETVTSGGRVLKGRWVLPERCRDDTGVIFASAFPGYDAFAREIARFHDGRTAGVAADVAAAIPHIADPEARRRLAAFVAENTREPYVFDRKLLFRILAFAHAELAELVRAKGPNAQVNAACASTTVALALAEDWIRVGRCRRVLVVGADDVTSPALLPWIGSGFLASGAATAAASVEEGALPFDRRRHGMILGMGASALVVETASAARERGVVPVARLVATSVANSAFHGSRLDVDHIAREMATLLVRVQAETGRAPAELARDLVFLSHETYTPARGGSASAEAAALRAAFGARAGDVVIANTKGFTGHPMGAGIEDVVAVKALQFGRVPPIANLREVDPEFAGLQFSVGGTHERRFALRLAAGFGSQLALAVFERVAIGEARIESEATHAAWLAEAAGGRPHRLAKVGRLLRLEVEDTAVAPTVARTTISAAVQVPVQPSPVSTPAFVASAGASRADVLSRVRSLVAERTGYPVDVLDETADMEADLGIDTVKQAEIFGALREAYAVPREDGVRIKDYPTLGHVADYIAKRVGSSGSAGSGPTAPVSQPAPVVTPPSPTSTPSSATGPPPATSAPVPAIAGDALAAVRAAIAARTGYPVDVLDADADLEADLGIDTVKQAEIFAEIRETFGIPRVDGLRIKDYATIAKIAGFVEAQRAAFATTAPTPATVPVSAAAVNAHAPAAATLRRRAVRWTPIPEGAALAIPAPAYVIAPPDAKATLERALVARGVAVVSSLKAARSIFAAPPTTPEGLLEIVRAVRAPEGAALDGLVALHATPGPRSGAILGFAKALARERPKSKVVGLVSTAVTDLLEEAALDGPVERRRGPDGRETTKLVDESPSPDPAAIAAGDVVLLTGGATGITAACAIGLARATPGLRFVLSGRTALPEDADDLARRTEADWASARERARAELTARGERATPVAVERALAPSRRAAEAARTLAALYEAGAAEARYVRGDVASRDDVHALVAEASSLGRLALVVHGAGTEESKLLEDKSDEAFLRVLVPKAVGALHLVEALDARAPDAAFICFGSIAGRFGNAGQVDYSAANALLASLAETRRASRVVDWTAWGETGMATRGSTLTVLASVGVEPISTAEGVAAFVAEALSMRDGPSEVVVSRALGALEASDPASAPSAVSTWRLEAEASYLADHRIDGTPVLPGVMTLERFATETRAASGTPVGVATNVAWRYPVKLLRDQPVEARVALSPTRDGFAASLETTPAAPKGATPAPRRHADATLAPGVRPKASTATLAAPDGGWNAGPEALYGPLMFHGPGFQVIAHVTGLRLDRLAATLRPGRETGDTDPLAIEAALQAAGLWSLAVRGEMGLPRAAARVTWYDAGPATRVVVKALGPSAAGDGHRFDAELIDDSGRVAIRIEGLDLVTVGANAAALADADPVGARRLDLRGVPVFRIEILSDTELAGALALLSPRERTALEALAVPKRRRDWLSATLVAKAAARAATGRPLAWTSVEIVPDPAGGRRVDVPAEAGPCFVTLSHAPGWAAACAWTDANERFGLDVEKTEERPVSWHEEAFTPAERARFAPHPTKATRAWCVKEAFTKVIGTGLAADLHAVTIDLAQDGATVDVGDALKKAWSNLGFDKLDVACATWNDHEVALARASKREPRA